MRACKDKEWEISAHKNISIFRQKRANVKNLGAFSWALQKNLPDLHPSNTSGNPTSPPWGVLRLFLPVKTQAYSEIDSWRIWHIAGLFDLLHHVTPSYIVNTNPTYSLQLTHLLMFTVEGLRVPAMWCPDQVIPMIYTPALHGEKNACHFIS